MATDMAMDMATDTDMGMAMGSSMATVPTETSRTERNISTVITIPRILPQLKRKKRNG